MDGDRVAGLGRAGGGERASDRAAGPDRRAAGVAGLQVMAGFAETGGSKGQALADTKPVAGFLVAGHPLGARGTCPVLAGFRTAASTASAGTSPLVPRIGPPAGSAQAAVVPVRQPAGESWADLQAECYARRANASG